MLPLPHFACRPTLRMQRPSIQITRPSLRSTRYPNWRTWTWQLRDQPRKPHWRPVPISECSLTSARRMLLRPLSTASITSTSSRILPVRILRSISHRVDVTGALAKMPKTRGRRCTTQVVAITECGSLATTTTLMWFSQSTLACGWDHHHLQQHCGGRRGRGIYFHQPANEGDHHRRVFRPE